MKFWSLWSLFWVLQSNPHKYFKATPTNTLMQPLRKHWSNPQYFNVFLTYSLFRVVSHGVLDQKWLRWPLNSPILASLGPLCRKGFSEAIGFKNGEPGSDWKHETALESRGERGWGHPRPIRPHPWGWECPNKISRYFLTSFDFSTHLILIKLG